MLFCRKANFAMKVSLLALEVCEDSVEASGRVAMLIGCSVNQAVPRRNVRSPPPSSESRLQDGRSASMTAPHGTEPTIGWKLQLRSSSLLARLRPIAAGSHSTVHAGGAQGPSGGSWRFRIFTSRRLACRPTVSPSPSAMEQAHDFTVFAATCLGLSCEHYEALRWEIRSRSEPCEGSGATA